jgi:5-methyltetrahydropteroyltriglutamate--homocysteine methyltransferase
MFRDQLLMIAKTHHILRLRRSENNGRRGAMKRSTERILTTHAGRLPNPDNIAAIMKARADGDQVTFDRLMQAGVADRVRKQMELRNDIHSDGEFWKARDEHYYKSRVTGVEMRPLQPGEGASILVHQQERHMPEFREFYEIYDQIGNTPHPGVVNPRPAHKALITGPMQYKGQDAIKHELEVVKAGIVEAGAQVEDFFFPVLGPGWLGHFLFNAYYPTEEEYVYAMAAMFQGEYKAVVEAGFLLQIDDPGLADKFGMFYPPSQSKPSASTPSYGLKPPTGPSGTFLKTGSATTRAGEAGTCPIPPAQRLIRLGGSR